MTEIICPACTLPILDDERVTVQFEGAPDEVWHRDCFERELREFYGDAPEVMGLGEIAEAFGVTLRTASRWADRPDFPPPLPGSVSGRPAWDREAVMAWEPPDPRGGRPPKTS